MSELSSTWMGFLTLRILLPSLALSVLMIFTQASAQEYSEREAHLMNAWARYAAEAEAGKEPGKITINPYEFEISAEALDRKDRSNAILEAAGIPVSKTLPVIETEAQSTRRSAQEVAERVVALMVTIAYSETEDQDFVQSIINDHDASDLLTQDEIAFVSDPEPSYQDIINASWRYEAVNTLLWALGFFETMGPATELCDVKAIIDVFMDEKRAGLIANAQMRSQSEILDAADLVYRQRWAAVEAEYNGEDLSDLMESGVLIERHHALNWLIGYLDQDWDDVSTDT